MSHRAQQIIEKVQSQLQARLTLGVKAANVVTMRSLSFDDDQGELPAIAIHYGEDEPSQSSQFDDIWSVLSILITAYDVNADEASLHQSLLDIRREIQIVMHSDASLSLPFVVLVKYAGAKAPELNSSTDMIAGRLQMTWRVTYAVEQSDPIT